MTNSYIELLTVMLVAVFHGSSSSEITFARVHINSTWNDFCARESVFKSSLSSYVSYKTKTVTQSNQIVFLNIISSCGDKSLKDSIAYVTVSINNPNNGTQNLHLLERMVKFLENGANVGGFQIISAKIITANESSKSALSTKTILIIIGAVLVVYLVGYFCVLSTQSDSFDEVNSSQVYMVSTVNELKKLRLKSGNVYTVENKHF